MTSTSSIETKSKQVIRVSNSRASQERSVPKFLKKVYHILEENRHNELLSWSNDGMALIIKRPTDFAKKVLPLYFKHNNFSSFIRQVLLTLSSTIMYLIPLFGILVEHVQVQKEEELPV